MQAGSFRSVTPLLPTCELTRPRPGAGGSRAPGTLRPVPGPVTTPPPARGPGDADTDTDTEPVSTLRASGSGSGVDPRRVGHVLLGVGLAGVAALCVGLFVAGAHRNAQIADLRRNGVPVTVTVTGCLGQLGGSGSNAAAFTCRGAFVLDGRRDTETLPGAAFHRPGTVVREVSVPGDPGLLATPGALAGEHPSGRVYVLPAVLAGVLVVAVGLLVARRRRARRRAAPGGQPARRSRSDLGSDLGGTERLGAGDLGV